MPYIKLMDRFRCIWINGLEGVLATGPYSHHKRTSPYGAREDLQVATVHAKACTTHITSA
jgi:hypothetical protein